MLSTRSHVDADCARDLLILESVETEARSPFSNTSAHADQLI